MGQPRTPTWIAAFRLESEVSIELKSRCAFPVEGRTCIFGVSRGKIPKNELVSRLERLVRSREIRAFEIRPDTMADCEGFHEIDVHLTGTPRTLDGYLRRLVRIVSVVAGE